MNYHKDTISAVSTPQGVGGLAVIRISGPKAVEIADSFFQAPKSLLQIPSRKAVFGKIYDNEQLIDEVIITVYRSPNSYTGEDLVEISCHGSIYITSRIMEMLLRKTRLANRGEFTQRAFLNDKMGLTKAEAIGDLIESKTQLAHLAAIEQYKGSLRKRIAKILTKITDLRTLLELEIDFAEQGLEQMDHTTFQKELSSSFSELSDLINSGKEGIILKEGLKVCLVGAPNVGKSSIFNALLQTERAIVTPHPGTTRDYLEEAISLNGYLIRIFDTAGLRQTEDQIEQAGIDFSLQIIRSADKILYISEEKENKAEYERLVQLFPHKNIIKVINKIDLLTEKQREEFHQKDFVLCSAITEDGLNELKQSLLKDIEISKDQLHSGILTNVRQIAAAQRSKDSLQKAIDSFSQKMGYEFTAFDLKEASSALEEIIGKITSEDILARIFENFCIGK